MTSLTGAFAQPPKLNQRYWKFSITCFCMSKMPIFFIAFCTNPIFGCIVVCTADPRCSDIVWMSSGWCTVAHAGSSLTAPPGPLCIVLRSNNNAALWNTYFLKYGIVREHVGVSILARKTERWQRGVSRGDREVISACGSTGRDYLRRGKQPGASHDGHLAVKYISPASSPATRRQATAARSRRGRTGLKCCPHWVSPNGERGNFCQQWSQTRKLASSYCCV